MSSPPISHDAPGWADGATRRAVPHLRRPRLRAVVVLLVLAAAAGGGWWWLRDSPLANVDEVRITGLGSPQTAEIRAALTAAAQDMSTLHVREELLRTAVARYPIVADVRATGDFPGLLKVQVVEHLPVAAVQDGGRTIAVAGDGTLLRGVAVGALTTIAVKAPPAGRTLRDPLARAQVRILAAAPAALRARVTRMSTGARGMQAHLKDGPIVAFGAPDRLAAKWAALAAVIADPSSAGATMIDVTVPESPAAAGLEPLTPGPQGGSDAADTGTGSAAGAPASTLPAAAARPPAGTAETSAPAVAPASHPPPTTPASPTVP